MKKYFQLGKWNYYFFGEMENENLLNDIIIERNEWRTCGCTKLRSAHA